MKTKNKILALVEIVIVLCSVFLVAMPAIAAEQTTQKVVSTITTASEDDYVLGVYGNANEDDTIDMRDLTYVKLIFFGKKPETELADAKYDGKINPLDFIQIKLIIVGKEKEITLIDSCHIQHYPKFDQRIVTIRKPVERIIPLLIHGAQALKVIEASDKIVGVPTGIEKYDYYWPELLDRPRVGNWRSPDYEAIVSLSPDIVISHIAHASKIGEKLKPLGIPVVGLDFHKDHTLESEMEKLGYILENEDQVKVEEYLDWLKDYQNMIRDTVKGLPEDKKPRVLIMWGWRLNPAAIKTFGPGGSGHLPCVNAGGINIAAELGLSYPNVDSEWILEENPDVIVIQLSPSYKWGWKNTEELKEVISDVIKTCGWDNLAAVKNNRVYVYSSRIAVGLESNVRLAYWAKWFHPDKFGDLDPEEVHKEYLEKFMKIDYSEDVISVYKKES